MEGEDFMAQENSELIQKLKHIELALQEHENDTEQLKQVVEELKSIVQALDKEMAIKDEKQSHLFYRIEMLQKQIEDIEARGDKTSDKQRDLVEKALMAFLGGLITYIFSLANK